MKIFHQAIYALPLLGMLALSPTQAQQLSDPTRPYAGRTPPAAPATQRKSQQVQAIFRFADARLAIIDGELVREGAQLHQMTINAIGADHVRYTRNGQSGVLRLPSATTPHSKPATDRSEDLP